MYDDGQFPPKCDTSSTGFQATFRNPLQANPALNNISRQTERHAAEPEYRSSGGLGIEEQKELQEFVTELGKTRDAIRAWDPNRHHLVQVVFNLVPLSSWTSHFAGN